MASKNLVIVESPAKARTIGKMLGGEYEILASMGHIRDLPEHTLGVDIENRFAPRYVESKSRAGVIKQLRSAAKKAGRIYLAPDPDREGEAIAWHLYEILKDYTKADFARVTFHEITRSAIGKAFHNTGSIEQTRVDSQQARRILDRLVGYRISPLLWSQIEKGISAGRVQSVALRLVVEREREINLFQPQEYWNFIVSLQPPCAGDEDLRFDSRLVRIDGGKLDIDNQDEAAAALAAIKSANTPFRVVSINAQPRSRNAPPPFITSTLQQAASSSLGFAANRTMRIAQQLYEGIDLGADGQTGLITYMRTDSVAVARDAQEACRRFIAENYGADYVPEKPNFYKSKSTAQEAHEAIRPTETSFTPDQARPFLDDSQFKLYSLIWRRFVASQMSRAIQQQTSAEIELDGADKRCYQFRTTATVTTFPGFLTVYRPDATGEEEDNVSPILAKLREGDRCRLLEAVNEQKFTEPPPRFSEASLIRELESNGIGRPSTYASIVNTIQERNYVLREQGRLYPSELGFRVNDFLVAKLPKLFQVGFTAEMEARLDQIEEGSLEWTNMLQEFYDSFEQWLQDARSVGAPEREKVQALLRLFATVTQWCPAEKRGKRTYDDRKFVESLQEQYAGDKGITAKQWQAMLSMAAKYRDQIGGLQELAKRFGFAGELEEAAEKLIDQQQRHSESQLGDDEKSDVMKLFDAFSGVKWDAPETRRGRTYDDAKLFESFRKQVSSGKKLSEKQMAVMARFAEKYRPQLSGDNDIAALLGSGGGDEVAVASQPPDPELAGIFERMARVSDWKAPVSKGKRVFDDQSFFVSLKQQFESGRTLTPRQIAALKKMAGKYLKPEEKAE